MVWDWCEEDTINQYEREKINGTFNDINPEKRAAFEMSEMMKNIPLTRNPWHESFDWIISHII